MKHFLTHTVQMKPKKEVESIILKLLLNPHGSDETWNRKENKAIFSVFLTHTVQMKPCGVRNAYVEFDDFLTHTVQMKPIVIDDYLEQYASS